MVHHERSLPELCHIISLFLLPLPPEKLVLFPESPQPSHFVFVPAGEQAAGWDGCFTEIDFSTAPEERGSAAV